MRERFNLSKADFLFIAKRRKNVKKYSINNINLSNVNCVIFFN